jgi:sugar phosphate permease
MNAFGNILAYGLIQISRYTTYKGWRWIFIIEGILTVVIAGLTWLVLIDFPHSKGNSVLSEHEKSLIYARLSQDRGSEEREKVTWKKVGHSLLDWKLWSFSFIYLGAAVGLSGLLFFLPLILNRGMNFTVEKAYLLSAPPQVFAAIVGYAASWLADRVRLRGPFVIGGSIVAIVGLCMIGFITAPAPR